MIITNLFSQATQYHNNGEFEKAKALYCQILKKNPENMDAHYLLATILNIEKKFLEAEKHLDFVLKDNLKNSDVRLSKGICLMGQERLSEAQSQILIAIQIEPNFIEAYFQLFRVQTSLEDRQGALNSLKVLNQLSPNQVEINASLSSLAEELLLPDDAEPAYKCLLKLEPENSKWSCKFGKFLMSLSRFQEAIKYLQKAVKLDPNNENALFNLAVAYQYGGAMTDAIKSYRRVLKVNPKAIGKVVHQLPVAPTGELWLDPKNTIKQLTI